MREILFRAKRLDNGEWRGSTTISKSERLDDGGFDWYIGAGEPANQYMDKQGNMVAVETLGECLFYAIDPDTVGQFTGLTDKNGKKIFEGDIVNIGEHNQMVNGRYRAIYDTTNHCWGLERSAEHHHHYFTFSELNGFAESSEVIGNIHDNPELLEVDT